MAVYQCVYEHKGREQSVTAKELGAFTKGFWVNGHGGLTNNIDLMVYWIPPGRILYVEKCDYGD